MIGFFLAAAAAVDGSRTVAVKTFATGAESTVTISVDDAGSSPPRERQEVARLPASPPVPTALESGFSTLYRARDVIEIAHWPVRAVAKLNRLDDSGKPIGTACTAQFVGPRHLVTARHCVTDQSAGQFHQGFDLAVGFDGGMAVRTVPVMRAWVEQGEMRLTDARNALVTPERCSDLAVISIAEPLGDETGWLGMRAIAPTEAKRTLLHRFSYPHRSSEDVLAEQEKTLDLPPAVRAVLARDISAAKRSEADFSPDNLYYEFGYVDQAEGRFVADTNGYVLPGRSGAALIDSGGHIVALLSRGYEGTAYSCRLDSADIGFIRAIMAADEV